MSYIDEYAPVMPRTRAFGVRVAAYVDTVTLPEAQRVRESIGRDPRTRYLCPILEAETGGYTLKFEMECPCLYVEDGFTADPYADWQNHLTDPLPKGCETVDYQILS